MNSQGWTIKGVEGIQSGYFEKHMDLAPFSRDSNYGFGFTEGILIIWEKAES